MKSNQKAFSLIELLCVIAVLAILMSLLLVAVGGTGDSQKLRSTGDLISGLGIQARQHALGKNTLTAIVILGKNAPAEKALQSASLYALNTNKEWEQISPWKQFPTGIIADPDNSTFFDTNAQQPAPAFPTSLTVSGQSVNSFGYQIFLPNGRVLSTNSVTLKLAIGFLQSGNVSIKTTNNYLTLTFIPSTGQTKIYQP
ncbi:MAG: Tfp pilus assembly protein FimT/FimU [Chthoniobacterales bacterium]